MNETRKYKITEKEEQIRLDKAMSMLDTSLSRMAIQKAILEEKLLVNGKKEKASYKVKVGDHITIEIEEPKEIDLKAQDIELEIIYEDNDILVVNKQKGLVVHPGNGNPDGTLVNAVMAISKDTLSGIGGEIRPGIVHRLDKDTSGVIVVAKNDAAHIHLSNQIKGRKVEKTYVALVRGEVKENEATINMPIARSIKDRKKMAVNKTGKEAVTHFKVLERYIGYTYLELKIETGRTHQIRVHLAEIGYPVVGDNIYSNGKNPFGIEGQALHAKKLKIEHPRTGEVLEFEAQIPEYLEKVLKGLKKE